MKCATNSDLDSCKMEDGSFPVINQEQQSVFDEFLCYSQPLPFEQSSSLALDSPLFGGKDMYLSHHLPTQPSVLPEMNNALVCFYCLI